MERLTDLEMKVSSLEAELKDLRHIVFSQNKHVRHNIPIGLDSEGFDGSPTDSKTVSPMGPGSNPTNESDGDGGGEN